MSPFEEKMQAEGKKFGTEAKAAPKAGGGADYTVSNYSDIGRPAPKEGFVGKKSTFWPDYVQNEKNIWRNSGPGYKALMMCSIIFGVLSFIGGLSHHTTPMGFVRQSINPSATAPQYDDYHLAPEKRAKYRQMAQEFRAMTPIERGKNYNAYYDALRAMDNSDNEADHALNFHYTLSGCTRDRALPDGTQILCVNSGMLPEEEEELRKQGW